VPQVHADRVLRDEQQFRDLSVRQSFGNESHHPELGVGEARPSSRGASRLDETAPNATVVQVVEDGYAIGDRVLRPAKVGVSRGGPKSANENAPT